MKRRIFSVLFAVVLAFSLVVLIAPASVAKPGESGDPPVTPTAFEQTYTPGTSQASFEFSTAETIDGPNSAKLYVNNLQDSHEGIKIGVDFIGKLNEITASTLSLKFKGNLLQEIKGDTRLDTSETLPGPIYLDHSPYIVIDIDLGTDVGGHGSRVCFHATDLPIDGGPRITATGPDANGWYTVTPKNPAVWNGFFRDGKGIRTNCTAWDGAWPFPMFDTGTLDQWHGWISAVYPNYTVKIVGVGYGFIYPNYPGEGTAYVDDLTIDGVTYNFEPGMAGSSTETTQTDPDTVVATTPAYTEVIKSGSGTPTITVAEYEDNPGTGFSGDIGKYIDVHIDDTTDVDEIEIRLYYTDDEIEGLNEASLRLYWWDGSAWTECSDSGVNPADTNDYSGYIWAKIRGDTTPDLDDLTGAPFGGGGRPPVVGGTVYPVNKVSILMPWIGLAVALALAGVFGTRLARRRVRG